MKGLKTLTAVLAGIGLLAMTGAPASASRSQHAFTHYVACGLSQKAKPAHFCLKRQRKGAFFRSNIGDVRYSVCVRFPSGRRLCARQQEAKQGTLYVNKVTSNIPGRHAVAWYVKGKRVGLSRFLILRHPPRRHQRARK